MVSKRKIVVYIYLVLFFVVILGVKDAEAAYNVEGFNKTVTEGIKAQKKEIVVSNYKIASSDISDLYYDLYYSNPYLFVANFTSYSLNSSTNIVTRMYFTYDYVPSAIEGFYDKFNAEVKTIMSGIKSNMTDVQKALYIHDYIVTNYSYDYNSYLAYLKGNTSAIPSEHYTAMGVMVNKTGVCQGYALAYNYLMNKLGIESEMVTSSSMQHAWNIIKIGGKYYHVDVSWDDPTYDTAGGVSHKYFLLSDGAIGGTAEGRTRHYGYKTTKKASSTKYDKYFWKDVNTGMIYYGNYWYYINSSGNICRYSFSNNKSTSLKAIPDKKWTVIGSNSYYVGCFSRLVLYKNKIYFNTKNKIYNYNASTNKYSAVRTANTSKGWAYGISVRDNIFVYHIKKSPSAEGDLYAYSNNKVLVKAADICNAQVIVESRQISKCKITVRGTSYTGKGVGTNVVVKYGNRVLKKGTDYTLSYKNNVNVGYGVVTITGKGNYLGKINKNFRINPKKVTGLKVAAVNKKAVKFTWSKVKFADYYEVYKYNSSTKKYVKIGTTKNNYYLNKNLKSKSTYYYKVVPCATINKIIKFTGASSSALKCTTK